MTRAFSSETSANTPIVTTTETVALTLPAISTRSADEQVSITGSATVTVGTGSTAVTVRIRQGTGITGAIVNEGNPRTVVAGNTVEFPVDAVDVPGEVAGLSYVLTVQQTAATGNGTALYAAATVLIG